MANTMNTSSVLVSNTFCFETKNIDAEKIPNPIQNGAKFGILNFQAITCSETTEELEFLFVIDTSGSMSDICTDGRSKIQHIIHTLKNMIIFLNDRPNIKANIIVNAFDICAYRVIDRTRISPDSLSELLDKIDNIRPKGKTNIEYALTESSQEILSHLKDKYPTHRIQHIFMTDGEVTDGSDNIDTLKSIVVPEVMNAFIGFGIDHDSVLLNELGSGHKSNYYFIDKVENAGFVYGEILHAILYKVLEDAEISVRKGLIYNYKNNTWVDKLHIGDIVSEANKTYNIISDCPDEFYAEIRGLNNCNPVSYLVERICDKELSENLFRQRTLQIMFQVNQYCKKKREYEISLKNNKNRLELNEMELGELKNAVRNTLIEFMDELKTYMESNGMNENRFMKNLCDDIYICFNTFDTKYGSMYCTARQTSQGTQRQYTVSDTQMLGLGLGIGSPYQNLASAPRLTRNGIYTQDELWNYMNLNIDTTMDYDMDNLPSAPPMMRHVVSQFSDTPYLSPQATQVMHFVSSSSSSHTQP